MTANHEWDNPLMDYQEAIILPEPGLKSGKVRHWPVKSQITENFINIYPNPAGNYFIVQYDLSGFTENGILAISDMNGQELKQYGLRDLKNQVIIGTREYSSGIYLISLMCGKIVADSQKISIIR